MSAELIVKMKARIDQCRRLAETITDPRSRRILLDMAEQGEADMKQFQAEEAARQAEGRDARHGTDPDLSRNDPR